MAPLAPRELPEHNPHNEADAAQGSLNPPGSRYSWRVKDCLICSWYQLSDPYSIDEMWSFLRQGRFSHARRVE
jgi:hypothetical protein